MSEIGVDFNNDTEIVSEIGVDFNNDTEIVSEKVNNDSNIEINVPHKRHIRTYQPAKKMDFFLRMKKKI